MSRTLENCSVYDEMRHGMRVDGKREGERERESERVRENERPYRSSGERGGGDGRG